MNVDNFINNYFEINMITKIIVVLLKEIIREYTMEQKYSHYNFMD